MRQNDAERGSAEHASACREETVRIDMDEIGLEVGPGGLRVSEELADERL